MVNKKNKKKILYGGLAIGLVLIFMAVQQMTFIDTRYDGITSCNKETGCTSVEMKSCQADANELMSIEGWECGECKVYCSNTNEMKRRNFQYTAESCDFFSGGGALVEAKARCTLTAPKSNVKQGCVDGSKSVYGNLKGEKGFTYPKDKTFIGADVWWFDELDKAESKVKSCSYACEQLSDFTARCITATQEDRYESKDHKGCFAISGRNEAWYYDSDNKLNSLIEICSGDCNNGKCIIPETPTTTTPTTEDPESETECYFAPCTEATNFECSDGIDIIAYSCEEGCSLPTNEVCSDGEKASGQSGTSVTSSCELYQKAKLDGTCSFDITQFQYTETYVAFYEDFKNSVLIGAGVLIILISLTIGGVILSKKKGVLG